MKIKVIKLGTKEITREGWEYELTLNFELINQENKAVVSKGRTGLFNAKGEFVITADTGKELLKWCYLKPTTLQDIIQKIVATKTIQELNELYKNSKKYQEVLLPEFKHKKEELDKVQVSTNKSATSP